MSRVAVIGAGMSGLAAAHRLQGAGHEVIVLERSAEAGGSARTERHGEYLVDIGPDALNTSYRRLLALARDVGLTDAIVSSSSHIDIIRDGRPSHFDGNHPMTLLRSGLLSPRARLGLAAGYVKTRRRIRDLDPYDLTRYAKESNLPAEAFARKAFGTETAEWLLDPIIRVFSGTGLQHTSATSVLGALAVGAHDLVNVLGGMQAIPAAVAGELNVRCGVTVTAVDETADAAVVSTTDGELRADACLLAVMYEEAAAIWPALREAAPGFGNTLQPIPLISISLGYDTEAATEAYSLLVPTAEEPDLLCGFMQQHKTADRAPDGHTLVTLYTEAMAGPRWLGRSDDEIADWADGRLTTWYPELAGHRDMTAITRWPRTGYIPERGYFERSRELRAALPKGRIQTTATLFGSGSLERAVLGGQRAADRLALT